MEATQRVYSRRQEAAQKTHNCPGEGVGGPELGMELWEWKGGMGAKATVDADQYHSIW